MRSHRWYGTPAVAVNVVSKYVVGAARGGEIFAVARSGFHNAFPPAAVASFRNCQSPEMLAALTLVAVHITMVLPPGGTAPGGGATPPVVKLFVTLFAVFPAMVLPTTRQ